jgi:hypothetical protein
MSVVCELGGHERLDALFPTARSRPTVRSMEPRNARRYSSARDGQTMMFEVPVSSSSVAKITPLAVLG